LRKRIAGYGAPLILVLGDGKDIVSISGPQGLRLIRGFNDESLSGDWSGFRSSRLNQQYRVIYRGERQEVRVDVVSVTPHDYRRK
jgi:addiction module RelE/StbE family toxin